MSITIVTPPAARPVDLTELKDFLRVDSAADDDALLSGLIDAWTEEVEAELGQALITQTRNLSTAKWSGSAAAAWELPYPPLQAVSSIQYYDDGALETWDAANYVACADARPGLIWPANAGTFPYTDTRPDAVQVTFTCGYGDTYASVPQLIQLAIKMLVHDSYADRSAAGVPLKERAAVMRLLNAARFGHAMVT